MNVTRTRILQDLSIPARFFQKLLGSLMCLTVIGERRGSEMLIKSRRMAVAAASVVAEAKGRAAFEMFIGKPVQEIDVFPAMILADGTEMSASAIATDGENLFVMERGVASVLPLEHLCDFHWEFFDDAYNKIAGVGWISRMQRPNIDRAQIEVDRERAQLKSGLFVDMNDENKPIIQVQMIEPELINKWLKFLWMNTSAGQLKAFCHATGREW